MPETKFNLLDSIEQSLNPQKVGVVEFAESTKFCNTPLYPRQQVLLKLFFLEELTGEEEDILDYWINGGRNGNEILISPNIRDRVEWLRESGYQHFKEIVLPGGRRSSKGFCTGIAMAKVMWDTLQLQDPNAYYGIEGSKDICFSCVAGSEQQAKEMQFGDFSGVVENCKAFEPYLVKSLETEIRVATETDLRKITQAKLSGNKIQKDIARLRGKALAANAGTIRGTATMVLVIDEAAHMLEGESKASAEEVYKAAKPSLGQFGIDGLVFLNSSPYTKIGMFYERYSDALRPFNKDLPVDDRVYVADDEEAKYESSNGNPRIMTFQYPSWAQPLDAGILTPTGWRLMDEIQVGDEVIGQKGVPIRVLGTKENDEEDIYKITLSDGQSVECSGEHLWTIHNNLGENRYPDKIFSTLEIKKRLEIYPTNHHYLPTLAPVEFKNTALPIPPYALGALLGDGCFKKTISPNIADFEENHPVACETHRELLQTFPNLLMKETTNGGVFIFSCQDYHYHKSGYINPLKETLKNIGLLDRSKNDKFIPEIYQRSSLDNRFALLQGLLDTDGEMSNKNAVIFYNSNLQLINDVRELVELLGGTTTVFVDKRKKIKPSYRVTIKLPQSYGCPFRMPRKKARWECLKTPRYNPGRKIISVERVRCAETKCLEVDSLDGLYVTDHGVVTHNCLYEGYQKAKYKFKHVIIASPEWDLDDPQWNKDDKVKIREARAEEDANPDSYKVENRGKFAEVSDAFLNPSMVDRMYAGVPSGEMFKEPGKEVPTHILKPLRTNTGGGVTYSNRYKFHLDPSSTTAGFGFAIAHTELFEKWDGGYEEHVVFDLVKRWVPKEFGGSVIKWGYVLEEVFSLATTFMPFEITFDQHNSVQPIQELQEKLNARNIQTRVYEKTASNELNWKRWETFKTVLYQGLVHAPNDTNDAKHSALELKFLQENRTGGKFPRVDRQEIGPIQTKDIADCICECTYTLLGNLYMNRTLERLANFSMYGGAPGGYGIGFAGVESGPEGGPGPPGITDYYNHKAKVGQAERGYTNPARGALGRRRGTSSRMRGR